MYRRRKKSENVLLLQEQQLYEFQMKIKEHKIPVLVLFEGWGASGKGSTIGKVIKNIDPRFFKVATMDQHPQKMKKERSISCTRYFKQYSGGWQIYISWIQDGWNKLPVRECLEGKIGRAKIIQARIESIQRF